MNRDRDIHPRRQRLRFPAVPGQAARPIELDRPLLRLPLLIGNIHHDPGMRVGPLKLLDGAFQRHSLGGIKHREGMMSGGWDRVHRQGSYTRDRECSDFHRRLHSFLSFSLSGSLAEESKRMGQRRQR